MDAHIKITDPLLILSSLIIASIFLYLPTTISFVNIWTDENNPTYSHGPLLLLVSIFFIFRNWQKKENEFSYQPSLTGIILLTATSLLWFVAHLGDIQFVQQIALLFIIIFTFLSLLAYRQIKSFLTPLLLLLFAIPIWDFTNIYLREIAVYSVVHLLNLTGVLSISEGFSVLIPAGVFEIVEGCSGQGQLIVALAISCLYSYLHPMRWNIRIILILAAALTAIITNVLRIYIVIVSGQLTQMQHYFVTTDHVTLGWVVFAIGMFIYFIIANYSLDILYPADLPSDKSSTNAENNSPEHHIEIITTSKSVIPHKMILLVVLAICSGPLLAYYFDSENNSAKTGTVHIELTSRIGDWQVKKSLESSNRSQWQPLFIGAETQQHGIYQSIKNEVVEINKYHYQVQQQGSEAVSDANRVYQDNEWKFISREFHEINIDSKTISIEAIVIESHNGIKKLVLKYYSLLGINTSDPILAKLLNIWGIITHRPDISVVVVASDIKDSYTKTLKTLQKFISEFTKLGTDSINEST